MIVPFLLVAFAGFVLSATAGMGGSLILVPAMVMMFGGKSGIALAALLLAANNLCKVVAYRQSLPIKASAWLVVMTVLGATIGANLLVAAPGWAVDIAVALAVIASFIFEFTRRRRGEAAAEYPPALKRVSPVFALIAGATSGFSGTSGPLKGIAIRSQGFDRGHLVGAASLVSLWGDVAKSALFFRDGLLPEGSLQWVLAAVPLMPLGTWLGRRLNREMGERLYAVTFWSVMAAYCVRLALV